MSIQIILVMQTSQKQQNLMNIILMNNYNSPSYYRSNPYAALGYLPPGAHKNRRQPQYGVQIPQGNQFFDPTTKKHYGFSHSSEIEHENVMRDSGMMSPLQSQAMQRSYFRSLNNQDIQGSTTNTLISKAVRNKIKAQQQLTRKKQMQRHLMQYEREAKQMQQRSPKKLMQLYHPPSQNDARKVQKSNLYSVQGKGTGYGSDLRNRSNSYGKDSQLGDLKKRQQQLLRIAQQNNGNNYNNNFHVSQKKQQNYHIKQKKEQEEQLKNAMQNYYSQYNPHPNYRPEEDRRNLRTNQGRRQQIQDQSIPHYSNQQSKNPQYYSQSKGYQQSYAKIGTQNYHQDYNHQYQGMSIKQSPQRNHLTDINPNPVTNDYRNENYQKPQYDQEHLSRQMQQMHNMKSSGINKNYSQNLNPPHKQEYMQKNQYPQSPSQYRQAQPHFVSMKSREELRRHNPTHLSYASQAFNIASKNVMGNGYY